MKRILATAAIVLLALPMPVAAQNDDLVYSFPADGSITTVDLLTHADRDIVFEVHPDEFDVSASQVLLDLSCDCGASISRTMGLSGGVWSVTLPVDHSDLVVGNWSVEPVGTSNQGASDRIEGRVLDVTADGDDADPMLVIRDLNTTTNVLMLGAGELLVVEVDDPLLRDVTYQIEGMPSAVTLQEPYQLGVQSFATGASEITILATDRTGRSNETTFTVYADDADPVVSATVPDTLFDGVPNTIQLVVQEDSEFNVTMRGVNATVVAEFDGDDELQTLDLDITPIGRGQRTLEIIVRDILDNSVRILQPVRVDRVVTDVVLLDASVSGGPAVSGEALRLTVEAHQALSVADVPVDVHYGDLRVGSMVLPHVEGNNSINATAVSKTFPLRLSPGQYAGPVRLVIPDRVNETSPGDEVLAVAAEVHLGRVLYKDDRYHIRTDDGFLPSEAVDENGTTYELRLEDEGLGSVYAFDVDGVRLYWHPGSNTTRVPEPEEADKGEDSPGFGWFVLPVLAAVAMRRRR